MCVHIRLSSLGLVILTVHVWLSSLVLVTLVILVILPRSLVGGLVPLYVIIRLVSGELIFRVVLSPSLLWIQPHGLSHSLSPILSSLLLWVLVMRSHQGWGVWVI